MSNMSFDLIRRANSTPYAYGDLVSPVTIYPTPYAITLANMRLSLAALCAFVDFSSAGKLTPYLGSKIEVIDSAGKKATGYIKAAGTGETLGSEIITAWANSSPSCPYETLTINGNGHDITSAINTAAGDGIGMAGQNYSPVDGALRKSVFNITLNSGEQPIIWISPAIGSGNSGAWDYGTQYTGANTKYFTENLQSLWLSIRNNAAANFSSTFSLKQVLTPSATGVTIVSTPGGSVQSWESIETGFNANDASGYTCQIYLGGHVYYCSTAGTSDSSAPTFNPAAGSTTTDGSVVWTECSPSGIPFYGPLTFTRGPKYGDYRRRRKYVQPISYAAGGDLYVYDKGLAAQNTREITLAELLPAELTSLLEFIDIVCGAKYAFTFTDENGTANTVIILNADDIASAPVKFGLDGGVRLNLFFIG